jgi:uracil-DNA glycosylase
LPFQGLSGKLVDGLLLQNRIDRASAHVTNAALCRSESSQSEKDNERAALHCAPRLLAELAELDKQAPILALGKAATAALTQERRIFLARGFVWRVPEIEPKKIETSRRQALKAAPFTPGRAAADLKHDTLLGRSKLTGRVVLPSLHPAFVLRSELWLPVIKADFRRLGLLLKGALDVSNLDDAGYFETTTEASRLNSLGPVVSLDVETTIAVSALRAKLLCVGLSDGKKTVVLWPWSKKMAAPLSAFLISRKAVIGHNVSYDSTVLAEHGVS